VKVMVVHPGHSHSTSDVYDGLCAGLRLIGVEVLPFRWDRPLRMQGHLLMGAVEAGYIPEQEIEYYRSAGAWLAAADAIGVALDNAVDAVIVVNGILFPPSRASLMCKLGIPVACFGTEAPYFLPLETDIRPSYTHWFTNERRCVEAFGKNSFYLSHAYNPELHVPGPEDPDKAADVVFVGGGFPERKQVLAGVDWSGISLATRGTLWHLDLDAERGASDLGRSARYSEGVVSNTETAAWHRSSTVALNLHRRMMQVESGNEIPAGAAESLGPRAYEIPAVGGFMLCDDERPELFDVYGESAATFRAWDSADLDYQIHYWLRHPDARERIRQAQAEAVAPHHWGNRAKYVMEVLL